MPTGPGISTALGDARHRSINDALARRLGTKRPLIAVHRGTGLGLVPENTVGAVRGAVLHGADIVEIDIARSSDGQFFVFHEGYELRHFGITARISQLTATDVHNLRYSWKGGARGRVEVAVTRLQDMLAVTPDVVLNIDRSWGYWPDVFPVLAEGAPADRLLIKCPRDADAIAQLAAYPVAFPTMLRVKSINDLDWALTVDQVNVVGIELIVPDRTSGLADPEIIPRIRDAGLLAWVNAITLGSGPEYLGWDDNVSVLEGADAGWSKLLSIGADVVQTDWPAPLRALRDHT